MIFGKKKEKEYTESCALCEYATYQNDGTLLCKKKGEVEEENVCRGFSYDIMKRKPKRKPKFTLE